MKSNQTDAFFFLMRPDTDIRNTREDNSAKATPKPRLDSVTDVFFDSCIDSKLTAHSIAYLSVSY